MKQAGKIVDPPVFNPMEGMKSLITNDDRIQVLLNQSQVTGLLLCDKKRTLLIRFWDLQFDIFEKTQLFDVAYGSDLSTQIKNKMPKSKNKINKATNPTLAKYVTDLFEPFSVLHTFMLENDTVGRKLRSDEKKDSVLALAETFVNLKEKVDNRICEKMQNDSNPLSKWMVRLTDEQRERCFDRARIPVDPAHQKCLVCGLSTINEPIENEEVLRHNRKVDEVFESKMKAWNAFLEQKERSKKTNNQNEPKVSWPKDPTEKGKLMKRMPKKGAYKCQVLQCMAATSKCLMRGSDCCTS